MRWRIFFGFVFFLIVVGLLVFYWFVPFKTVSFEAEPLSSNFSLDDSEMQFYPNMRFPDSRISYKIYDCTLQKENEMEWAFDIIGEGSVLDFYPVSSGEEISVNCDSQTKMKEEGLFIAGEGGPTNVTQIGDFYAILSGSILLIRDSKCEQPNVAIHELLHVLGFNHSTNSNNIMYPVLDCDQTIGDDVFALINELYSVPSYPDLVFQDVFALINGRYLDTNITIKNNGFKDSESLKIIIYADDEFVKEIELDELKIGHGIKIALGNLWVPLNVEELKFVLEYPYEELEKNNNEIKLKIKN